MSAETPANKIKTSDSNNRFNLRINDKYLNLYKLPALAFLLSTSVGSAKVPEIKNEDSNNEGTRIAFTSYREGRYDIYTMNPDGTQLANLTSSLYNGFDPEWSPDGEKIAFTLANPNNNYDIFVMNSNGSNIINLSNNTANEAYPTWSPNGDKIAFVSNRDGDSDIYLMNSDGTNQTRLTNNTIVDGSPRWNPRTNEIIFESWIGNPYEIHIFKINTLGQNLTQLTFEGKENFAANWSPSGDKISFTSNRDGNMETYIMNSNGTNQTRITSTPNRVEWRSAWSPDGNYLAIQFYFLLENQDNILILNLNNSEESVPLSANESINNQSPSWSKVPIKNSVGFLNLPIPTQEQFNLASQGNINGLGPGRVNSWFDHQYPTYNLSPNNLFPGLLRWDGRFFPEPTKIGEGWYDGHNGIDFKMKFEGEQAFPAAHGEVFGVVNNCVLGDKNCGNRFGNQVWIDHQNGYATLYAHLKNVNVTNGQTLTSLGTPLGVIGSTGNSTNAHLHFGVYFDQNQDGIWVPNEAVDPYGWQGISGDPWSMQSSYLWKDNLWNTGTFDSEGGILNSPSGNASINFPPGVLASPSIWELWENSASLAAIGQLRNIGTSLWLRYINQPNQQASNQIQGSEPITITTSYEDDQLKHLDESALTIKKLSEDGNSWEELPTTVDTNLNSITAQADLAEGQFDLQAPLLCPEDSTEPNDSFYNAQELSLQEQKVGILDIEDDEDWFQIVLEQGQNYEVVASPLTLGSRTSIEVYDVDGSTLLAAIDGNGEIENSIGLPAPRTGQFYVKVSNTNGVAGCSVKYALKVNPMIFGPNLYKIFLPIATK